MKNYLAIPVIPGEKTPEEKFPGAENTYTVEAIMQTIRPYKCEQVTILDKISRSHQI
jgi:prolyl-tRNA synthetase